VFERFTIQARAAVALAIEEARTLGHAAVGTEHVLLGLVHSPDTVAGRALSELGIELTQTRVLVGRALGSGESTEGRIPFTPAAQRALELAVPEAARRGRDDVAPEDVLLAVVAEPGGGAALILVELGASPDDVRTELEHLTADRAEPRRLAHWPGLEATAAEGELEVGWRGRAIALAALGAAVLGRTAFDARRTGPLEELEMQLLVFLSLGLNADAASAANEGEAVESLPAALACDRQGLRVAIESLLREQLVVRPEYSDDDRVAITPAGVARVQHWLARIVPVFGGWPPERPGVDDATG
jgi:Clp amino terminal domain, pathogenicity island component